MSWKEHKHIRVAVLDLYEGAPNEGMRCIREIVAHWALNHSLNIDYQVFDVRQDLTVPDISFDIYISSGGPGSPTATAGQPWDDLYMQWLKRMDEYNRDATNPDKKHVFFICHSFQLACRYFEVGDVCKRKSTSFGVFPVHMLQGGVEEQVFQGMSDPFYAVDSRDYQVISPNHAQLKKIGAEILAIEKHRPHVPYERAIMSIRFNDYFIGTQFHPEADAIGMSMYLQREDKKQSVIEHHGAAKWQSMVDQLQDPEKILWTNQHILPNFLNLALGVTDAV